LHVGVGAVGVILSILGFILIRFEEEPVDHNIKFPNYRKGFYVSIALNLVFTSK
jgi:hypothetical protein